MNATPAFEYHEHVPAGRLGRRVKCIWALRAPADPAAGFEPVYPDGCPELVLNLADPFERQHPSGIERQTPALLLGQLLEPVRLRPSGRCDIVGIRFHPWGLSGLFEAHPVELVGRSVAAADLPSAPGLALAGQLLDIPELGARCQKLADLLRRGGLGSPGELPPVAVVALGSGALRSVSRAARYGGVSCRQVERQCAAWTGLSPQELIRLLRFQRALGYLRHRPERNLAWIAHASGFADHAHFTRDFGRFAGLTPSGFRRTLPGLTAAFLAEEDVPAPDLAD